MRPWFLALVVCLPVGAQTTPAVRPNPPKLVLAIVVDQFRYDYLTKFKAEYKGGLKRMMEQGAVFTNANYEHVPTVTAIGHSTFLTGATPAMSGIIGNDWYDRTAQRRVTSVTPVDLSPQGPKLVGAPGTGSTPERLLQSTVGDELKMSGKGGKVIGISIKDRSAILPVGRTADAAYWFDGNTGNFVSSTYYFPTSELPAWVSDLNKSRPGDKYAGKDWMGHKAPQQAGRELYTELESTPWGNELIQTIALKSLTAEKLGIGNKIDLLAVSYSSNDYVGHRYGPDAPEARDMAVRVDQLIGDLLRAAEAQVGAGRVLVVMTADHGVAPVPEVNVARKMPGGRFDVNQARAAVEKALNARFGESKWVVDVSESGYILNSNPFPGKVVDRTEVERVAAETLRAQPHVFRVYTRGQLLNGNVQADQAGRRVINGFNEVRSADVVPILEPYWLTGATGTSHGTFFSYDTHVPVMFLGPWIKAGRYNQTIAVNDIAPTLATILEVETPSGSVGRALAEILK